ncbi:5'/3'-nucleotidase SurE [Desulfospira joergensenii]|uniref:5'/3'-nucleotidase SurE n=1 Tax=Desulfospira joergensenii TaxID=53329 RepID=UPI0003B73073|nr:5'/3'-nucleotidase SurE [Desulfospira joergensenii]
MNTSNMVNRPRILLTNDDGIHSPGLKAAVEAVMDLADLIVAAPSVQQTGMGRSLTGNRSAGLIPIDYKVNGQRVTAYHCECSPALVTKHALKVLYPLEKPDLLVSGINYGENLGINVTTSGTIGAALEASSYGIPAIAISKQTDIDSHHEYTNQDWSASRHFLNSFAKILMTRPMPRDVDLLKIDIPTGATSSTPWKLSKLAKSTYYSSYLDSPSLQSRIGDAKLKIEIDPETLDPESDIYVFAVEELVSVTPMSLDSTSRVSFPSLQGVLNDHRKNIVTARRTRR